LEVSPPGSALLYASITLQSGLRVCFSQVAGFEALRRTSTRPRMALSLVAIWSLSLGTACFPSFLLFHRRHPASRARSCTGKCLTDSLQIARPPPNSSLPFVARRPHTKQVIYDENMEVPVPMQLPPPKPNLLSLDPHTAFILPPPIAIVYHGFPASILRIPPQGPG